MDKSIKKFCYCIVEVILGTALWCLLDYFSGDPIDIIHNLISVGVIVLICNIVDFISNTFKKKK